MQRNKILSLQPISEEIFPLEVSHTGCGVEQRQLVGLITRRSEVRILPPLQTPTEKQGKALLFL